MFRRPGRFFWKLFLVNAALMGLVLSVCLWVILAQFDRSYKQALTDHLTDQARALEVMVRERFDAEHIAALDTLAKKVGTSAAERIRVTFVLTDGTVLGDSEADPIKMESHADRPEIRQALAEGVGESTRWSDTVRRDLRYVAVRVGSARNPRGVVRVAMAVRTIGARTQPARRIIATIVLASLAAAVVLALGLALLWSRRIGRITEAAQSLSQGDLSARVTVSGKDEVAVLGQSLNRMRHHLSGQLATIDRQRRTLDSLVSQLSEGVVVADASGRIVLVNPEAERLLRLSRPRRESGFAGLAIEQCMAQPALRNLLRPSNGAVGPEQVDGPARSRKRADEIKLELETASGPVTILARSFDIQLPPSDGAETSPSAVPHPGRVLVLTDVTELSKIMQVKADFAANASHELRTPLSAIRAAVETLRTAEWVGDADRARHFLEVIDRHSSRMEAMSTDLLELARLESPSAVFEPSALRSRELLEETRAAFAPALAVKQLHWETEVARGCERVVANAELLRMVLRNLVDNAVRFTDRGGHVRVTVYSDDGAVCFTVADDGCGIAADEQSRVFERFYQVQRARSGEERGTGLGLSIVRHAVAAMNAQVELESEPGSGTRVTVTIPQPA